MKNEIPQFLLEKFKIEKTIQTTLFPDEIKQFMLEYSKFYNWDLTKLVIIFKLMKQGISLIPECEYQNCNNKRKINLDGTLTKGCCKDHNSKITKIEKYGVEHHMKLEENKKYGVDNIFSNTQYIKDKVMKKYGVENVFQNTLIKARIKQTNLEKYGVANPSQSKEILKKKQVKWQSRYGGHPFQNEDIKKQIKQTNLEKYGVENPNQSEDVRNKFRETNIKKYGVEYPLQNQEIKDKMVSTNLEKYGVEYPMQNQDFYNFILKKSYNQKKFIWQSGDISQVQGYEGIVLNELENQGYNYEDVITSSKDMPEIWYDFENKKHRYFPDFYIPKENLIIEVKSEYTLQKQWDKNQAKFQAVKDAGFNFRLEVR